MTIPVTAKSTQSADFRCDIGALHAALDDLATTVTPDSLVRLHAGKAGFEVTGYDDDSSVTRIVPASVFEGTMIVGYRDLYTHLESLTGDWTGTGRDPRQIVLRSRASLQPKLIFEGRHYNLKDRSHRELSVVVAHDDLAAAIPEWFATTSAIADPRHLALHLEDGAISVITNEGAVSGRFELPSDYSTPATTSPVWVVLPARQTRALVTRCPASSTVRITWCTTVAGKTLVTFNSGSLTATSVVRGDDGGLWKLFSYVNQEPTGSIRVQTEALLGALAEVTADFRNGHQVDISVGEAALELSVQTETEQTGPLKTSVAATVDGTHDAGSTTLGVSALHQALTRLGSEQTQIDRFDKYGLWSFVNDVDQPARREVAVTLEPPF